MLSHSLVIGYHGCDRSLVESVVVRKEDLKPSQNAWDWLGHGIYFWEDSPARALNWAEAEAQRRGSKIKTPAVLGAVIQLGNCLNLTETESLTLLKDAYQTFLQVCAASGSPVLENRGAALQVRFLDCAVIETVHQFRQQEGKQPFDTVRRRLSRTGPHSNLRPLVQTNHRLLSSEKRIRSGSIASGKNRCETDQADQKASRLFGRPA
jgi:hypothetical protein